VSEQEHKPTVEAALKGLTGFDEVAIEQAFRADLSEVMDSGSKSVRALIFVLKRREGLKDKEAFQYAMEVSRGDLNSHFTLSTEADASGEAEQTASGPSS
jgi:hypothetical protein